MRSFSLLLPLFLLLMITQKKQKVILFGDSITELGNKPGGYVQLLDTFAMKEKPGQYEFTGSGVSGNKVYDLFLRLEKDVLSKSPDLVVIYIGVNDVWHKSLTGTGTDADKFERFYVAILDKLEQNKIRAVICTPAVIGEKTDNSNQQDGDMNQYSNILRRIAAARSIPLVDLRQIFLDYNSRNNPDNKDRNILTYDRVHLNEKGNRVVAESIWKVLGSL